MRFKHTRFIVWLQMACIVKSPSPTIASTLPAGVSMMNGAQLIQAAPIQPLKAATFTRCAQAKCEAPLHRLYQGRELTQHQAP